MAKIYAYFREGVADGECHAISALSEGNKLVPPERLALDESHIYILADQVKGVPDSYIYIYDPLGRE